MQSLAPNHAQKSANSNILITSPTTIACSDPTSITGVVKIVADKQRASERSIEIHAYTSLTGGGAGLAGGTVIVRAFTMTVLALGILRAGLAGSQMAATGAIAGLGATRIVEVV